MKSPVDTSRIRPSHGTLSLLPARAARSIGALPLAEDGGTVTVCFADAGDFAAVGRVEDLLPGRRVEAVEARDPADFRRALRECYPDAAQGGMAVEDAFSHMLRRALALNASDIHVCPRKDCTEVRLRVDGRLSTESKWPAETAAELASYIKVLANLDISERRSPQDGNIDAAVPGGAVSVRVATIPTIYGEHVTLRILGREKESGRLYSIEGLGMHERQRRLFENALETPDGVIVLSGPTGSGKTTTLYAALRKLALPGDLHILSVEDPVEKPVDGVTQVKIDARQDRVSFARALRSVLRHDPDVLMIGEIRDEETASAAMRSALTGHLVLTTLHTSSAPGILSRLLDLGVPPYMAASTLRLAVAQRLLRRPCRECMTWEPASAVSCRRFGWDAENPPRVPKAHGCAYCGNTGYDGRTAVYEMLRVDAKVREMLLGGAGEDALYTLLESSAPELTLKGDAAAKILEGETTEEEYRAAVAEDRGLAEAGDA